MALVERLMGLNSDGSEPSDNPDQPKIPVHPFFAACGEIIAGAITIAQVKSTLNTDAAADADFDALIAIAPTGTNALSTAEKALFVERVHGVFILAEGRFPGYSTAAQVRAKLGIQ